MGKIYTAVFVSTIGVGTTVSESFFFDWSVLPESKYKVSFTFLTGISAGLYTNVSPCNLFCDLGQGAYTTIASPSTSNSSYSANFIGVAQLRECTVAALAGTVQEPYLVAETNTNAPFFIDSRPRNNMVNISMLSVITATGGTSYAPVPGPYTLTFSFEMCE